MVGECGERRICYPHGNTQTRTVLQALNNRVGLLEHTQGHPSDLESKTAMYLLDGVTKSVAVVSRSEVNPSQGGGSVSQALSFCSNDTGLWWSDSLTKRRTTRRTPTAPGGLVPSHQRILCPFFLSSRLILLSCLPQLGWVVEHNLSKNLRR